MKIGLGDKIGRSGRPWARAVLLSAWIVATGAGFAALARHQWTPGEVKAGTRDITSLEGLRIPRGAQGTIVLFAHPRCPCTPASLRALGDLTPADGWGREGLTLTVVFVRPAGARGEGWNDGRSRTLAREIRGATLLDIDESQVRPLGVRTSGHVVGLDECGTLRLDGGITPGRGHEGESHGLSVLRALVKGDPLAERGRTGLDKQAARTEVFGCALMDEAEALAEHPARVTDEPSTAACCALSADTGARP